MALTSPSMSKLCLVPAKHAGIVSLSIQLAGLVMSTALAVIVLLHLTRGDVIDNVATNGSNSDLGIQLGNNDNMDESMEYSSLMQYSMNESENATTFSKFTTDDEPQFDLIELLRTSTVVYIAMSILWLLSLMSLLASIKLESLDLIIINSILLTFAMIYTAIHALFISTIYIYYRDFTWTTMAITSAAVLGLSMTSVICGFALAFSIVWYKYVVFITDNDQCQCLAAIAKVLKRRTCNRRLPNEYSIPEATRHANLPYDNMSGVQHFSRL